MSVLARETYKRPMQYQYYLVNGVADFPIQKQREIIEKAMDEKGLEMKRKSRIHTVNDSLCRTMMARREVVEKDITTIVARHDLIGRTIQEIAYVVGLHRLRPNCFIVSLDCMTLQMAEPGHAVYDMCENFKILARREIQEMVDVQIADIKLQYEEEIKKLLNEIVQLKRGKLRKGLAGQSDECVECGKLGETWLPNRFCDFCTRASGRRIFLCQEHCFFIDPPLNNDPMKADDPERLIPCCANCRNNYGKPDQVKMLVERQDRYEEIDPLLPHKDKSDEEYLREQEDYQRHVVAISKFRQQAKPELVEQK